MASVDPQNLSVVPVVGVKAPDDDNAEGIGRDQSLVVIQKVERKYQALVFTSAESATLTQTCT